MRPEHPLAMNINFSAGDHMPEDDLKEAYDFGVRMVRLNIISYATNTIAQDRWKALVQQALDMGYHEVIFGYSSQNPGITALNISTFGDGCLSLASWFDTVNDPRLIFQLGNEEELHHDSSITNAQIRSNIRSLATDVKSTYNGRVIYSSSILTGTEIASWASEGRGDLDKIAFNLYGSSSGIERSARAIYAAFGRDGWVTEWGLDEGFHTLPNEGRYADEMEQRMKMIKRAGIERIYYYNWMESNNKWGLKVYPDSGAANDFRAFSQRWRGVGDLS